MFAQTLSGPYSVSINKLASRLNKKIFDPISDGKLTCGCNRYESLQRMSQVHPPTFEVKLLLASSSIRQKTTLERIVPKINSRAYTTTIDAARAVSDAKNMPLGKDSRYCCPDP